MLLIGKTLGVTREMRGNPGNQFEQVELHVLDGIKSVALRLARNFDQRDLPAEGEQVAVEVAVSAFSTRSGGAGVQTTALRRRRDIEEAVADLDEPFLTAVNGS